MCYWQSRGATAYDYMGTRRLEGGWGISNHASYRSHMNDMILLDAHWAHFYLMHTGHTGR